MSQPIRLAVLLSGFAVVLAMVGLGPTAHADLFNSRQTWLRGATTRLFMHWRMLTSPGYTDCAQSTEKSCALTPSPLRYCSTPM